MRTSLIEIEQIECWLLKQGDIRDRLLIENKMLSRSEVLEKVSWQAITYDFVHTYGRKKIRDEIKAIEQELFHTPKYYSFQEKIQSIFKQ